MIPCQALPQKSPLCWSLGMMKDEHPDLQMHLNAGGSPEAGPGSFYTDRPMLNPSLTRRGTIAAHSCEMDVKTEEKAESKGGTVLKSRLMDG